MKNIFYLVLISLPLTIYSQRSSDQFSIEADYGLNASMDPNISGLKHFGAGLRYMADEYWGGKIDFGFDTFDGNDNTGSKYTRISVQVVHNLGRTLNIGDYTNGYINILAHAGLGYSALKSEILPGTDNIGNVIVGLTPQFYISDNIALHFDTSFIVNVTQHFKFDGTQEGKYTSDGEVKSFVGKMFTASLGVTFYFGKNSSFNDWR